jgi:hypothetical protein
MSKMMQIGIHGPRNSGKTCYLAALYGKRTEDNTSLKLTDNVTIDLLGKLWALLEQGQQLDATPKITPTEIPFELTHDGLVSPMLTVEYSGELVQRPKDASPASAEECQPALEDKANTDRKPEHLAVEVLNWMKASDALFLIIDAETLDHSTRKELEERRNEIDLLLTTLQKGKRLAKPLALVVTKWDLYATSPLTVEEQTVRLHEFVEQHHLLSDVAKTVELAGNDFKVFPVSAFGGNTDKISPPKGNVHPFNTLAPLAWCVERVRILRQSARFRKIRLNILRSAALLILFNVGVLGYEKNLERRLAPSVDIPIAERSARQARYDDWVEDWQHWRHLLHSCSAAAIVLLAVGYAHCFKKETAQ